MNYGQKIMLKALTKGVVPDCEREEFDDWKFNQSSDDILDALIQIGLLFQWKDVVDGLPEVSGLYVVSVKGRGLMITGFASDSDSDKWRWEEKYDRYIPYPIPKYKVNEEK